MMHRFLYLKRASHIALLVLLLSLMGMTKMMAQEFKQVSKKSLIQSIQREEVGRDDSSNTMHIVNSMPKTMRSNGELDFTTYDWQSNSGAITRTIVWPDGKINFAYTMATNSSNYSDRGTGIGTYDAVNDQWIPSYGRVEYEKTGFGSIARYGQNGIVIAAHTSVQCGVYIVQDKDNITSYSVAPNSYLPSTYDPCWPNVMTSGENRDIIHVVATAYGADGSNVSVPGAEGVNTPIVYFRSQDGGFSWDRENVILPYMGPDYCINWGSNKCYWMETTEDNCLALVVNNAWSDGMVIYSYDNGDTWERKVFYKHPNPFGTFDDMFLYPRWTSCQWDNQHHLHVLYEFNGCIGEPGSGSYYPSIGGVAYWNETMPYNENGNTPSAIPNNLIPGQPFVMDKDYLYNDIYSTWWFLSDASHEMWPEYIGYLPALDDNGDWEDPYQTTQFNIMNCSMHGNYHSASSVCGFPTLCMVPGSDDMVAVWCAMDENNTDGSNYYYKLFAAYSSDGGNHWGNMVHLTNNSAFQSKECVYPQAALVNNQLVIACQMDGTTGTYVMGDDSDPYDNYYQGLTFDLEALFGAISISATANPSEGGIVSGAGIYDEGAICTLSASANPGYSFLNWTENGVVVSSDSEYSFTVTESRNLVANFFTNHWSAESYQNSMFMVGLVKIDGVEQTMPTLELAAFCNGECRGTELPFNDGDHWLYFMAIGGNNGDSISFRLYDHALHQELILSCSDKLPFEVNGFVGVDDPYEIFFVSDSMFTIITDVNLENAGTVTGAGEYMHGTNATVMAVANPGYAFVYWTLDGEIVSTEPSYTFTVTRPVIIIANFELLCSITAITSPEDAGTVIGTGDYAPGTSATLVATPNEGYAFNCWTLDGEVVSTEPSYTFTVTESMNFTANFDVLQLQQLTSGWNWFSTYLEITLDDLKAALLAAFPNVGANALVIKSNSNGNTAWNPIAHRWIGGLTTMDLSQMYMVKVPANAVITLQGMPINPADHPVAIVNGNNWIAFPFRENMSVNNAFTGFPVNGDIIKSNGDGAAAFYGVMWIGGLNTLNPGKGYIYKSNAQESRTFVFGTNAAK